MHTPTPRRVCMSGRPHYLEVAHVLWGVWLFVGMSVAPRLLVGGCGATCVGVGSVYASERSVLSWAMARRRLAVEAPVPIPHSAQAAHVRSVGVLVRVEYSSPVPVAMKTRMRVMAKPLRRSMGDPFWRV